MSLGNQLAEVLLQCVSARACQLYDVADGDTSMFASVFDDARRQLRQSSENDLFPFGFLGQALHVLLQCPEEKENPRLPVWGICPDRHLGLAKGEIIPFFALFNHAIERAVRYVGIARAEQ